MARIGSFLGPTEPFGVPLSVVKPPDNDHTKSRYHELLLDPTLKLDEEQKRQYQQEILELLATLKVGRDLPQS